jgi:hypothetical protein
MRESCNLRTWFPGLYRLFPVLFFLFLALTTANSLGNRRVYIFSSMDEIALPQNRSSINYLRDYTRVLLFEGYPDDIFINSTRKIDSTIFKEYLNIVFSEGGDGFFMITGTEEPDETILLVRLYSPAGEIYGEDTFILDGTFTVLDLEFRERWQASIRSMMDNLPEPRNRQPIDRKIIKRSFQFSRDYPFVSMSIQAISGKFYIDRRSDQKIFSFFPLDIRLAFFPLKYLEVGTFFNLDYQNMIYRYNRDNLWNAGLILKYGFFMGISYFNENSHFSFGLQFYNLYYDIDQTPWTKPANINAFFLPQFSIYQKWDFRLFKIIYFSVFINIKTMPNFYLVDNNLYSKPFDYDYVTIEFSFIGFSIIF